MQRMEFAEFSSVREFDGLLKIRDTAALCAGLEHAFLAVHGGGKFLASGDGDATRFLAVNIFACLSRQDGCRRVPAISGRDQHGIDIFTVEQLAEIAQHDAVAVAIMLVHEFLARLAPIRLHLGNGDTAYVGELQHGFKIVSATWTNADNAQRDFFTRRNGLVATEHAGRDNRCQGSRSRCDRSTGQKIAT